MAIVRLPQTFTLGVGVKGFVLVSRPTVNMEATEATPSVHSQLRERFCACLRPTVNMRTREAIDVAFVPALTPARKTATITASIYLHFHQRNTAVIMPAMPPPSPPISTHALIRVGWLSHRGNDCQVALVE